MLQLRGYYIYTRVSLLTQDQSLRSAINSLLFLNLSPIESVLIRKSLIGLPLLVVPTSLEDTKENTREMNQMKCNQQSLWIECCCHLIKAPTLDQGIVVQLTSEQYRDLVFEFSSSRPLYIKGRMTDLEPIFVREKRYPLFEEINHFSLRSRPILRKFFPLVLTAGVLSVMTWISETFESLDPTVLGENRSLVYFWVGESRIGKTVLSQTLVQEYEYNRGGINWQEYQGLALQVYDDLNFSEETISQNLKTLFNTSDEGAIRRVYGMTRIKRSAVLVLLNADTFISLKEQIATNHLQDWISKNSILYPFENDWDPDSDTISDSQLVYGKGSPSSFGEGIVLDRVPEESQPFLPLESLKQSLSVLFSTIKKEPRTQQSFSERVQSLWKTYGKGSFPTPQESFPPAVSPDHCPSHPVQPEAETVRISCREEEDEFESSEERKRMKCKQAKKKAIHYEQEDQDEDESFFEDDEIEY